MIKNKKLLILVLLVFLLIVSLAGAIRAQSADEVAFYHFDNNATDSSGYGNNGTVYGGAAFTEGRIGSSLSFDGIDDSVDLGNNPSLQITGAITIEAWVRTTAVGSHGQQAIISKFVDSGGQRAFSLEFDNGKPKIYVTPDGSGPSSAAFRTTAAFNNGNWHHVVGVFSPNTTLKVYVDGMEQAGTLTGTIPSGIYNSSANVKVGYMKLMGNNFFTGAIDEVRIYNRLLTADEVRQHYLEANPIPSPSPTPTPMANLKAFYHLDNNATDSGSYGNNGTVYGGAAFTEGRIGSSLSFDGIDDFVDLGNNPSLQVTGAITIEAWARTTAIGSHGQQAIVSKFVDAGRQRSFTLEFDNGRPKIYVSPDGKGQTAADFRTTKTFNDGQWHHIVGVFSPNTTLKIYVDGVEQTGTLTGTIPSGIYNSSANVKVGYMRLAGDNFFTGAIDEVRIYDYALSPAEIQNNCQLTSTNEFLSFNDLHKSMCFDPADPNSFYFIQISDTHAGNPNMPWNDDNFRNFIGIVESLQPKPAFVVVTGDLVENGNSQQWQDFYNLTREFETRLPNVPLRLTFGNHDGLPDIFLNLSPQRALNYSFDFGGIRFLTFFPHYNPEVFSQDNSVGLSPEQIQWAQGEIGSFTGETLVLFNHQPPLSGDFSTADLILNLQSVLSSVSPQTKVWTFNGHWHGNYEFQVANLKNNDTVYSIQTATMDGPDREAYRLVFARDGQILKSATKKLNQPYKVSPDPDTLPIHEPFYGSSNPILLFVNLPEDDPSYLVEETGIQTMRGYKDLENENSSMVYKVPMALGTTHLGLYSDWEYMAEVSSDGINWIELVKSPPGSPGRLLESYEVAAPVNWVYYKALLPLPQNVLNEPYLFVRFRDPYPGSIGGYNFESAIEWFALIGSN